MQHFGRLRAADGTENRVETNRVVGPFAKKSNRRETESGRARPGGAVSIPARPHRSIAGAVGDTIPPVDEVIETYKRDVDRTLLLENLKLSPEERARELMALLRAAEEFQRAGRALRAGR